MNTLPPSGDVRVNEHPSLVAMHTLWVRQHNKLARELAELNPHWNDEQIFQETRRIVGAQIQHITYNEFLPVMLGKEAIDRLVRFYFIFLSRLITLNHQRLSCDLFCA